MIHSISVNYRVFIDWSEGQLSSNIEVPTRCTLQSLFLSDDCSTCFGYHFF